MAFWIVIGALAFLFYIIVKAIMGDDDEDKFDQGGGQFCNAQEDFRAVNLRKYRRKMKCEARKEAKHK